MSSKSSNLRHKIQIDHNNMNIFQLATIFLIIYIPKSPAEDISKTISSLLTCTDKSCVAPFNFCDSLTGVCQLFPRDQNYGNSFLNFWNFGDDYIKPRSEKYTSVSCNEDGNYPSYDCQYFHQCINGSSVLKKCNSPGYPYFDPVLERCTHSSTCSRFSCFERFKVRVGLEYNLSSFFAYCSAPRQFNRETNLYTNLKNVIIPYVVTRCYGKDVLNENTGRCEPRCLQEGLLPDTTDCHRYFLCSLADPVSSMFTMTRLSCPQGQAFQAKEHRCVPEDRVQACTAPRAWPL